jgi:PAS domain-containing protein
MRIRKFAVGLWIFIAITAVSGSAYGWSRAAQNESWVWIAFSFIFVCSITGAVVATNSGYRNVNRETDAGARAANAEERARLLIEGSSDLIFTTLPNLQITSANAAAIAALGDDLNGKNFFDLISFDDISGVGPVLIMGELAELTEKKSKYEKRFRLFGNRGRTPEFVFRMEFLSSASSPMIKTGPTPEISSKLMRSKKFFPFKSSPSAAIAAAFADVICKLGSVVNIKSEDPSMRSLALSSAFAARAPASVSRLTLR